MALRQLDGIGNILSIALGIIFVHRLHIYR